ncbi:MAG: 50S ribosomal protein L6 [Candidatus Sumerlaeia bacterium]|nr:50S ribosomal protein L6 [Candidatus Sumerlaeia bacterium]
MSRIGNVAIEVPKGVTVSITPTTVKAKGSKGELVLDYKGHVKVTEKEGKLYVARFNDERQSKAFHGLYHRLITNLLKGVTVGFSKDLELQGVGYKVAMKGKTLVMNLGYSHPVEVETPKGITISTPSPTQIKVEGIDKQQVGQVAAELRKWRAPEPYKGKGIRYVGEYVPRKAGKSGGKKK